MLLEKRKLVSETTPESLQQIADYLCHRKPVVRPIFECVKVFIRLHESGVFTYARHPSDLGTRVVSARDISSRMNCPDRANIVLEALEQVESECREPWPFSPGSSSWTLIEILHPEIQIAGYENDPAIIFRKAVRLNHKGEHSSTALTEKIFSAFDQLLEEDFSSMAFDMVFDPKLQLENISGSGVYAQFTESLDSMHFLADGKDIHAINGLSSYYKESAENLLEGVCSNNFSINNKNNPGFYFTFDDNDYVVRPKSFRDNKNRLAFETKPAKKPFSIFGMIR